MKIETKYELNSIIETTHLSEKVKIKILFIRVQAGVSGFTRITYSGQLIGGTPDDWLTEIPRWTRLATALTFAITKPTSIT